jgi:hypothetical protein
MLGVRGFIDCDGARCVRRTGQDQMRIVKQRLKEMLPYLEVFLDVRSAPACATRVMFPA